MIDVETLVDHVRTYNPKANVDLICRAYAYGKQKHAKQKRHSGEPYFTHPIEVAIILAGQKLDDGGRANLARWCAACKRHQVIAVFGFVDSECMLCRTERAQGSKACSRF